MPALFLVGSACSTEQVYGSQILRLVRHVCVLTPGGTRAMIAETRLRTIVQNESQRPQNWRIRWKILNAANRGVASVESGTQPFAAGSSVEVTASAKFPNPSLW